MGLTGNRGCECALTATRQTGRRQARAGSSPQARKVGTFGVRQLSTDFLPCGAFAGFRDGFTPLIRSPHKDLHAGGRSDG